MYKFIKIKRFGEVGNWYFVPRSEKDILEHWKKYVNAEYQKGIEEITDDMRNGRDRHPTNQYYCFIKQLALVYRGSCGAKLDLGLIEKGGQELVNVLAGRISSFNKYHKTLLTNTMIESFLLDDDVIVEEKEMNTLTFPDEVEYNLDDVRYIQWDGGTHYYAKIGRLDICDKNGNYKWNTKDEAVKAAKWWIENN